jgi:DNA-binding response OmpR family regulator
MNSSAINYSKKLVLIVEDFAEFASSLRGMLANMGCLEIDIVSNGDDALRVSQEKKYDIILSDYNMGNTKDGQQVLEELHKFNLLKSDNVFLMITAENTSEMVMSALEYQPDSYLTKPFNAQILKSRLDKCLKKKQAVSTIIGLMQSKKWLDAIQQCESTIKKFPKYRMACLKKKFHCLKALKKYDEALELATSTFNEKSIPWAMLGVGEIYYKQKKYQEAVEVFSGVIKDFPMILSAYDWLAKSQYVLGDTIEAQKTLMNAIKRSPKILERQMLLGELSEKNRDLNAMMQAYRQAIKYGENSAFLGAILNWI